MIVHLPFVFVKPNCNVVGDCTTIIHLRFLCWDFIIFGDTVHRGLFIKLSFNNHHWKWFKEWALYKDVNWKFYEKY